MGDLDDILEKHEARQREKEKHEEEAAALTKQEQDKIRAAFKKCVDDIILPILSEYKTALIKAGYNAEIDPQSYIDARGARDSAPDKRYYNRVNFKFDTKKSTSSSKRFSNNEISFKSANIPNVDIIFTGSAVYNLSKTVEGSEFFIRETLKEIIAKAFSESA